MEDPRFYSFTKDEEVIEEIKLALGAPMVKIELDDSQWKAVIRNAKRWFMAKKSIVAMSKKTYNSSIGNIPFADIDTVNGCYKVLGVYPDSSEYGFPGGGGVDCTYQEILPNGYPLWGGSKDFSFSYNQRGTSYIMQIYQSIEQRKMLNGSTFDWFVQYDHLNGHALYITPNNNSVDVLISYKPATLPVSALKGRDCQIFYDWCEADAKEKLGRVRSKYSDYPGAGGNIAMDGGTLLEEAKETKLRLEEEISGSQGPLPIIIG